MEYRCQAHVARPAAVHSAPTLVLLEEVPSPRGANTRPSLACSQDEARSSRERDGRHYHRYVVLIGNRRQPFHLQRQRR